MSIRQDRFLSTFLPVPTGPQQTLLADVNPMPVPQADPDFYSVAAARVRGNGVSVQDQLFQDVRTLTQGELEDKYGYEEAQRLVNLRAGGMSRLRNDLERRRFGSEIVGDTATGVVNGAIGGLGSLAALAGGVVNEDLGTGISDLTDRVTGAITENQSNALNDRRRAVQAQSFLSSMDNEATYERERSTDGETVATLRRVGRNFADQTEISLSEGATALDSVAQGGGSLISGGLISGGLKAVGRAVIRGVGPGRAAAVAIARPQVFDAAVRTGQVLDRARMPLAIGALEGGGAYTGTVEELRLMSHDDLLATSEMYRDLIANGVEPERAKVRVMNSGGLTAAAIQTPIGVATGALVSKFEANPFRIGSALTGASNVVRETVEEGIQSGTGQFAQNVGARAGDNNRNLSEGVGEAAAEGALAGGGIGATFAGPSAAIGTAREVGTMAGRAIGQGVGALKARGERINARDAVSSTAQTAEAVKAAAAPAVVQPDEDIDADLDFRELQENNEVLTTLSEQFQFSPTEYTPQNDTEAVLLSKMTDTDPDIFTAMTAAAQEIDAEGVTPEQKLELAFFIDSLQSRVTGENLGQVFDLQGKAVPGGSLAKETAKIIAAQEMISTHEGFNKVIEDALNSTPEVTLDAVQDISTPEGQQAAKKVALQATYSPETISPEVVERLLRHSENSPELFSRDQAIALRSTAALNQTLQQAQVDAETMGLKAPEAVRVSREVQIQDPNEPGAAGPSVAGHFALVNQSLKRGEGENAAARLEDFRNFAQHYANKIGAVNESFRRRDGDKPGFNPKVSYQAYSQDDKKWYNNDWQTNRFDPKLASQRTSQQIGVDGEYVINSFNALAQQYPALGINPIEGIRLDDALRVPARQVFEEAKRQDFAEKNPDIIEQRAEPVRTEEKQQTQPETKATVEEKVEPEVKNSEERLYAQEDIVKGSDKQIIGEIERLENRSLFGEPLSTDKANLKTLRAERDRREEALLVEPSEVVEDTAVSPPIPEAVEEVAEPEAKPEVKATEETAAPKTSSIKEMFPNLVVSTEGENLFVDGFTLDNENRTRLIGEGAVTTDQIINALTSSDKFTAFTGMNGMKITPDVAQAYLATIGLVDGEVFDRMMERLKSSKDFGRHMKGEEIGPKSEVRGINLVGLRLINLMERQADGSLAFNDTILKASRLALSDWVAQNSMASPVRDKEDVAKALGVDLSEVTDELQASFNRGMSSARAHLSLTQKLEQYLGLKPDVNTPLGQSRGVILSMAGELLSSAINEDGSGLLVREIEKIGDKYFTFFRVNREKIGLVNSDQEGPKFGGQIALIQQIVMQREAEAGYTIGEPSRKQSQRLQNGGAPTTQEQRDTQVRENEVGHSINKPMLDIYRHLKGAGMLALFGNGALPDTLNKNDKLSKEGQNLSVIAAYDTIMSLAQEMEGLAGLSNTQLEDIKLHYEYDFTSVNRMQQQGSYGSQSSKLTREVITPYGETHDLSDPTSDIFSMWRRGLAQALGVKIELLADGVWDEQLTKKLDDLAMRNAISKIQGYENTTSEQLVDALKGAKIDSAVALHAVKSYADYLTAQKNGTLNEFRTHVYVEADGKTDGPTNSLFYMRLDGFDADLVRALARGGIQFSERAVPLPEYYAVNDGDAYQVAAIQTAETKAAFADVIFNAAQSPTERVSLEAHAEAVDVVLNTLLSNKDFEIRRDKTTGRTSYVIGRNQLKNPMTVTVYGSSPDGIAKKIAKELVGLFYEQISEANTAARDAGLPKSAWAALMFNGDITKSIQFSEALKLLTSREVGQGENGFYVRNTKGGGLPPKGEDAVAYTISPLAIRSLASALETFYVAPMVKAIEGQLGTSVDGSKLIQQSTNMLSVFAKAAFNRLMTLELEKVKLSDGLTPNQMKSILSKVSFLFPYMEGDVITVNVRGLEEDVPTLINSATGRKREVKSAASLTNELSAQLEVPMPAIAGVAGAAYVNISYGDGRMIIKASPGLTGGRLHIFDGINIALKDATKNGVTINSAVIDAMQTGTPFQDIQNTFNELTSSLNMDIFTELEMQDMFKNVAGPRAVPKTTAKDAVQLEVGRLKDDLSEAALDEKARHAVFARVHISSDHMAALNAPASTAGQAGREDLSSMRPEAVATRLQELFIEERAKLDATATVEAANPESEKINPAFKRLAQHSTGVRITSTDQLLDLLDGLRLPKQQEQMIRRAVASLKGPWSVVIGNMKQSNAYVKAVGIAHTFKTGDYGLAAPDRQTLIVSNGSAETLAHELIHAATFERVDAYMTDPRQMDPASRRAIERLDVLMNDWLAVVDEAVTFRQEGAAKAVSQAKKAINGWLQKGDRAAALNEFMAWNLSNQALMKLNSTIKVENTLARIAREVVKALRALFGLPAIGTDMNSNIRFHTMLLMSKRLPTPQSVAASRLLMHSTSMRPDLDRIIQKFASVLRRADMGYTKWLADKPSQMALRVAQTLADTVGQYGFRLTNEEKRAFIVMISAFRVNMIKDPAFAMKLNRYHRELLAQMNQSNMAVGDPQDPGVNTDARARIALLSGDVSVGLSVDDTTLLVPMFAALSAVSPEARTLFNKVQVRARKKGEKSTNLDEAVVAITDEAMNTFMDFTLGLERDQKIGDEVGKLVAAFVDQVDREKNFLEAGLEIPGRFLRQANTKLTDGVSFGLGKTTKVLDGVIARTDEASNANKGAQVAKVTVQLFDKNQVEEGVEQLMSWADQNITHPELGGVFNALVGNTESNQNVFVLIKQGRAIIDRVRETYRVGIPKQIMKRFSRPLTQEEWGHVHLMGQMDMHSLIGQGMADGDVIDLLADTAAVKALEVQKAADIQRLFGAKAPAILGDAADLAFLMMSRKASHGLVKRNALAIANRAGEATVGSFALNSPEVQAVDAYVSLLAMSQVAPSALKSLGELSTTEKTGMRYALSMMAKARSKEMERVPDRHRFNVPKGYMPQERLGSFKAVPMDKVDGYTKAGYRVVGSRNQSPAEALYDPRAKGTVYVATDLVAPSFKQGIMRTVRSTVFGLDANTGQSFDTPSAGLIVEPTAVKSLTRALQKKNVKDASLSPLYNEAGQIYAYERVVDPADVESALETQQNAAVSLGQWMGRQHEEIHGAKINEVLINRLTDMWDKAGRQARTNEYVDLFELAKTDPIVADALRLMSDKDKASVKDKMGGKFMVRRSMYENVIGFRSMSVGDLWTGNTRLQAENREALANVLTGLFGEKTYRYLTMSEAAWSNLMGDARVAIVVKSMLVPVLNATANFYQLMANGIGPVQIARKTAEFLRETHLYAKSQMEYQRLSVELAAAEGSQRPDRVRVIETELRKIEDLNKKLAIWPLIEAGEFSQITEGLSQDDMDLSRGRIWDRLEAWSDKLPLAVKTAGRYALITKDTALFAGLARAVAYTDFVAKSVLYDHLVSKEKLTKSEALLRITGEYVNYDMLDGRMLSYAENIGLVWFWKFKIRAIKVAGGLIRNNPLHTFLSSMVPGSYEAGTAMDDNGFNLFLDGRLDNSIGIDNAWRAVEMNPVVQAFS